MKKLKKNPLLSGTQIFVLMIGIVLIVISLFEFEPHTKDIINMIGWLTAVFALLSFLITLQLDYHSENLSNQLFTEREKISKLYQKIDFFFSEDELKAREKKLGLDKKSINNHVIIISNDLSKECGEWIEAVVKNVKNNVKYTYVTTKNELKYIKGIKDALHNAGILDIKNKLHVYCNETFFHLMQSYSEIVIYDNIGSGNLNIQECYICFSNNSDEESLLYEKVNKEYCERIINKLGIYNNNKNIIQSVYCNTCSNSLGSDVDLYTLNN